MEEKKYRSTDNSSGDHDISLPDVDPFTPSGRPDRVQEVLKLQMEALKRPWLLPLTLEQATRLRQSFLTPEITAEDVDLHYVMVALHRAIRSAEGAPEGSAIPLRLPRVIAEPLVDRLERVQSPIANDDAFFPSKEVDFLHTLAAQFAVSLYSPYEPDDLYWANERAANHEPSSVSRVPDDDLWQIQRQTMGAAHTLARREILNALHHLDDEFDGD